MKVLSFDPGAHRTGWALLTGTESGPCYLDSGVEHFPRGSTKFQVYRLQLANKWAQQTWRMLEEHEPDAVVSETVPSRGAGIPEQMYLANVQITTVHAVALALGYWVEQLSARTVQKEIAVRGNSKGITKPQVRNGVIELLPELKPRFKDWVKIYEEPDAIAIGLCFLRSNGYGVV